MQPTKDEWAQWEQVALRKLATGVKAAREQAGISQRALADAAGVDRGQIANLESAANPKSSSRTTELPRVGLIVRLSLILDIPPVQLLYPDLPDGAVEMWPGVHARDIDALRWFSGELASFDFAPDAPGVSMHSNARVQAARELAQLRHNVSVAHSRIAHAQISTRLGTLRPGEMSESEAVEIHRAATELLTGAQERSRANGWPVDE